MSKYIAVIDESVLRYFRLDDDRKTLVVNDASYSTRAFPLIPMPERRAQGVEGKSMLDERFCDGWNACLDELEENERLKDALEEAEPTWIRVDDKLPDNADSVLVWEKQGFAFIDNYISEKGWAIGDENIATITHWMPLPKPPTPEKKERNYIMIF